MTVAVEALLAGFLYVGSVATPLGQAPPPPIGILLAVLSMPAVVAADTVRRQLTARPRGQRSRSQRARGRVDIR